MNGRLLQMSGMVVDLLYNVDEVPVAGEEAIVNGFSIKPGGGFNAMIAARRAGMEVSYGGSLGTGPFAQIVRDGLTAEGIPSLLPQDTQRDQGCCTVMIDRVGDRTFLASDGAEGHVTAEAIARLSTMTFEWILLSGYALHYKGSCPTITEWLRSSTPISGLVFDPSPVVAALPKEALSAAWSRATWISANAREASVMTGCRDLTEAARALAKDRPENGGAVVRNGNHGCVLATRDICEHVPPFPVSAVDTNGAGDTHLGSFIAQLADGSSALEAARYANVAAALSTTKHGPATAPTRAEVVAAMAPRETV